MVQQKIYYHQKDGLGIYNIYLRYRTSTTGIEEYTNKENIRIYPNPTKSFVHVELKDPTEHFTIYVYSILGQEMYRASNTPTIDISNFANGVYYLTVDQNSKTWTKKMIKE